MREERSYENFRRCDREENELHRDSGRMEREGESERNRGEKITESAKMKEEKSV